MAFNNQEFEIKLAVDAATFARCKELLEKTATFTRETEQEDTYFTPAHRDFLDEQFPYEWLSIRRRGERTILNYKHFHPEGVEVTTHCDEYETVVSNPDSLLAIFNALDIKRLVTVKKLRRTYDLREAFEVALDDVQDLGNFIEIELTKDFGSIEQNLEALRGIVRECGLEGARVEQRGYPYQLLQKM